MPGSGMSDAPQGKGGFYQDFLHQLRKYEERPENDLYRSHSPSARLFVGVGVAMFQKKLKELKESQEVLAKRLSLPKIRNQMPIG